jgi:hypothetical protein
MTIALKGCTVSLNSSHNLVIACDNNVSFDEINRKHFSIVLNNTKITMPFQSFIANCHKNNSCSTFIRTSRSKQEERHSIIIGEVLFMNFAATFDMNSSTISFHRLNNIWGKLFANGPSLPTGFFHKIASIVEFFFKIIFYMSLMSLLINLYFNRRKIMKWFIKHFTPKGRVYNTK